MLFKLDNLLFHCDARDDGGMMNLFYCWRHCILLPSVASAEWNRNQLSQVSYSGLLLDGKLRIFFGRMHAKGRKKEQ